MRVRLVFEKLVERGVDRLHIVTVGGPFLEHLASLAHQPIIVMQLEIDQVMVV
jgi:hypothetical protein